MRKLILLVVLCLPIALFSQNFAQAPKLDRPVKHITEWQTFPAIDGEPEQTKKGGEYTFRRDGKLTSFVGNDAAQRHFTYQYDGQGRRTKVEMSEAGGSSSMTYVYEGNTKKAEIKGQDLYLVTTQFLNAKGQVTEEKTSGKASFTGGKFQLVSRKVLNYNALDSLFGEMEYTYFPGGKVEKKKTVHHYDAVAGKKSKSVFYGPNGKEEKVTTYQYNDTRKLASIETTWPGTKRAVKTELLYKDGKLWQEIENQYLEGERTEKVYKNGRLVRSKLFLDGELIFFTDFQYVFF